MRGDNGPVTHLVIVDYVGSYDGPTIIACHNERAAIAEYGAHLAHAADVRLVEVKRESKHTARRVAESEDQ